MGRWKQRESVKVNYKRVQRSEPTEDYLKFWRVVRYWAIKKYNLKSKDDLDMMLFLRGERFFSRKDFESYKKIFPFENHRFERLYREGWIVKVRTEGKSDNRNAMYELSMKAKRMVKSIYNKLNNREHISENPKYNRLFRADALPYEKKYASVIKKMNENNAKMMAIPSKHTDDFTSRKRQ